MLSVLASLTMVLSLQDPTPGISRELAAARSQQLTQVAYDLDFALAKNADRVHGRVVARFTLAGAPPPNGVVLDFAGDLLREVRINGSAADDVRRVAGHVLLPADRLSQGENEVEAEFSSLVAATGTPLTRYRDQATGQEYLYTLLVPADAHRLFPCFDQPDLKATFLLRVQAPAAWQVVGNGDLLHRTEDGDGTARLEFVASERISTYLFAFAAGDFEVLESPLPLRAGHDPERRMRMYLRPQERARVEADALFAMHARAVEWLATHFDRPYPFGKLDFVLVPGFPYGGMEHPGAIFYRDQALSFDHAPTEGERVNRSALVYHEVSHQWFGNLVSFVWFDDLWLKEGFATFMGYRLIEELEPQRRAWVAFHRRVKPRAYDVDATPGTTPVYQALANLADAKSAYGAIVYNKAPAVLRELEARLGAESFRAGVSTYLSRFAWGNATWKDLVSCLEQASEKKLERWSDAWILTAGLPRVRADWSLGADGRVASFAVRQEAEGDADAATRWPLRLQVLAASGTDRLRCDVVLEGPRAEVPELIGHQGLDWVVLNPGDQAYALFLLDARSVDALLAALPRETDPLVRAVTLTAMRETLRAGELDPMRFVDLALTLLADEREPEAHAWLLGALSQCLLRYLPPERAAPMRARAEDLLRRQLQADLPALWLQTFRCLVRLGQSDATLALVGSVVATRKLPGGLALGSQDAYLGLAALVAQQRDRAVRSKLPTEDDVAKFRYLADAATPTKDSKARYFATYLDLVEPPEQWVQQSLEFFHWPGQDELTLPHLRPALDQVEWVKQNRKIFFMPAWIDGFVNGHSSARALATVEEFLAERKDLADDIRRKILQSLDELRRVVRIRARWR
ncbi:MAG: M1 family aminopeptidase [Planctomycetota bacterium]